MLAGSPARTWYSANCQQFGREVRVLERKSESDHDGSHDIVANGKLYDLLVVVGCRSKP